MTAGRRTFSESTDGREAGMATTKAAQSGTAPAIDPAATDDYVNAVVDEAASITPQRFFTIPGRDPFDEIEWELRHA